MSAVPSSEQTSTSRTPIRWQAVLVAGVAYGVVGMVTAALAGSAGSRAGVTGWRLAAWALSLAIFVGQLRASRAIAERSPASAALEVALGVALGALLLAAVGPVRGHWHDPNLARVAVLSVVVWPVMTGVPAYVVAYVVQRAVSRIQR